MTKIPKIIVQLVHIQGPLKGQIQEFGESEISIGRHPSCSVQFPNDINILSRHHANIVRDGNRFKIVDQSSNGTFLNGKEVSEAYLKDGDVLIFAEGGPKVSFLTKTVEEEQEMADDISEANQPSPFSVFSTVNQEIPPKPEVPSQPSPTPPSVSGPMPKKVKAPLVIQFGPTLRTFNELPITIGKHPNCDFALSHDQLLDKHVEIYFDQDHYWLKDLTGLNRVVVNGQPIATQVPLKADDTLSLSPSGPDFRFLGGGRLAEIEKAPEPEPSPQENMDNQPDENRGPKSKSIFRKIWDR